MSQNSDENEEEISGKGGGGGRNTSQQAAEIVGRQWPGVDHWDGKNAEDGQDHLS